MSLVSEAGPEVHNTVQGANSTRGTSASLNSVLETLVGLRGSGFLTTVKHLRGFIERAAEQNLGGLGAHP